MHILNFASNQINIFIMEKHNFLLTKSVQGIVIAISSCVFASCSNSIKGGLEEMPVIAEKVSLPTGELVACDISKAKDTIDIPLSMLTEDLNIVKLDNKDDALVGGWVRTTISDNYILVSNNKQVPYKLFKRDGKFVCSIGSYGQGPDEYMNTYAEQLDDKHNRIYILPWQSDKILVFDLQGNPLPHIPLGVRVPKGKFRVDTADSTVTVTALPFESIVNEVVWVQDMHGNRIQSVPSGHLTVPRDFSNEVGDKRNTSNYDVMLITIMPEARPDSLYHYNHEKNILEPKFTVRFNQDPIPWHEYYELPNHFIGTGSFPIQVAENTWQGSAPVCYMVDKNTLKGSFIHLKNDFLNIPSWISFSDGYYVSNMEPLTLKDELEKALEDKDISDKVKSRIQELLEDIDENDNNIVLFAKLKE